ncbi:LOW QUALITY PROTEIN: cadherin-like protein 26 [Pelodytes ibericus]
MKLSLISLMFLSKVITHCEAKQRQDMSERKRFMKRSIIPEDSLRPHRRTKRRWVLTTILLEENDSGHFPKIAGDLFNDQAANYSIKYLISGPGVDKEPEKGLFSVNDFTGQVSVHRAIDREITPFFEICFDVAERTTGKIVDNSLIFNVEVKDKNDNAPVFTKQMYEISVKETANFDNPVFQVMAHDDDKEGTANSDITYSILSQIPIHPNLKFSIDSKSGLIRGQGCLNHEDFSMIKLVVNAQDNGKDPLSSTAVVVLNIEDGNNNMPVFPNLKYNVTVKEGEVAKDFLRLKVEDKDMPQTPAWIANFKILTGNENNNYNLTVDPMTNEGILSIVKPLDFEGTPYKILTITVQNAEPLFICQNSKLQKDTSSTPSTAIVTIAVEDTNDPPIFKPKSQTIREKEGLPAGTVIANVTAFDPDRTPNKIRYVIAQDPAGWVKVNENTGQMITVKELDRESPEVKDNFYTIVVHAIDDGVPPQTGSGTVLLYLSDLNDNTPRLVSPYMERCDTLKDPISVEAKDDDLDPYAGPFRFELADTSRAVKQIGRSVGNTLQLLMNENLPRGNYSVPLNIYDRQGLSGKQTLTVRVCSCPDGGNCEKMMPAAHSLGGGAIGIIFAVLLLFLLVLCLLMCFLCGTGKKTNKTFLPNDEGNQSLIIYNEEGGSALSQASPGILMANGNGNVGSMAKNAVGMSAHNTKHLPQNQSMTQASQNEMWTRSHGGVRSQADTSSYSLNSKYQKNGSLRNKGLDVFAAKVEEMLEHRLQGYNDEDELTTYKPRTYAYEGNLERMDSVTSISIADSDPDLTFLDDLGPKFSALEEICKMK